MNVTFSVRNKARRGAAANADEGGQALQVHPGLSSPFFF